MFDFLNGFSFGPSDLFTFYTGSRWDRKRRTFRRTHRDANRRRLWKGVEQAPSRPHLLKMTWEVFEGIRSTIGRLPAETGGALGGRYEDDVITEFQFDAEARNTGTTYSPNTTFLNHLFQEDWNPKGIRLLSFVHSHPSGAKYVSAGDREYATRILAAIPELEKLYLPIVMSEHDDSSFEIVPFVALRDGEDQVRIEKAWLTIISE